MAKRRALYASTDGPDEQPAVNPPKLIGLEDFH